MRESFLLSWASLFFCEEREPSDRRSQTWVFASPLTGAATTNNGNTNAYGQRSRATLLARGTQTGGRRDRKKNWERNADAVVLLCFAFFFGRTNESLQSDSSRRLKTLETAARVLPRFRRPRLQQIILPPQRDTPALSTPLARDGRLLWCSLYWVDRDWRREGGRRGLTEESLGEEGIE